MKVLALLFLVAITASGQTAKVLPLSPEDAALARNLTADVEKARKDLENFRQHLAEKYLVVQQLDSQRGDCSAGRKGSGDEDLLWRNQATVTAGSFTVFGSDVRSVNCPTEAEKKEQAAAEKLQAQAEETYELLHPMQYYRKGWGCGKYVFSEDFKFIVPEPEPTIARPGTITFNSGTLGNQQ